MEIKKNEKNEQKFYCSFCDFSCSAQSDWNRHILRPKHHKLANGNHLETKKREKRAKSYFASVENLIQRNRAYGNTSQKIIAWGMIINQTIQRAKIFQKKN